MPRRIIVPLGARAAADLARRASAQRVTIRLLVLRALTHIGIHVPANQITGANSRQSHPGAGRPRQKSAAYRLGVDVPARVLGALHALARKRNCSLGYLVRLALERAGIAVDPQELVPDRRSGRYRTPRTHYAQAARAGPRRW